MENPITKAALIVGSKAALARSLEVKAPTVQEWESDFFDKPPPIERCVQIEQITKGQVMRWHLRPNDWRKIWPELAELHEAPRLGEATHG